MPKRLLIGTHNPARIEMLCQILYDANVHTCTLASLGIDQEVEEDGHSTAANAEKKARFYYALSGIPTLAIDGGLHIHRFPEENQPGVKVKRAPGIGVAPTMEEMIGYYVRALEQVGGESPGTWTASQALAVSPNRVLVGTFTFQVRFTARRFGAPAPGRILDSLMIDPDSGKYYTELPLEERPYYAATRDFILGNLGWIPTE